MTAPQLPQQELDAIRKLGQTVIASRIAFMVGIGIMLADYMNTLSLEVQFYWRGKFSIPRTLYFIIRYVNFLIQATTVIAFFNPPSDKFCKIHVNTRLALAQCLLWAVQAVLIYRLKAVYNNKSLEVVLWLLLFITIATESSLNFVGANVDIHWVAQPIASLAPNLRHCVPTQGDFLRRTHYLTWVPTLVFDAIVFTLSLLKFIQFRNEFGAAVFKKTLMYTLLRDTIVYFAMLLIIAIAYMIVARIDVENADPASNLAFPLISVAGCRLLFHIRSKDRADLGISNTSRGVNGDIVFTEDVAMTRPNEFKVFSKQERVVPQERVDDQGKLMEEEGDYPCGA